jgi:hypothetical protein
MNKRQRVKLARENEDLFERAVDLYSFSKQQETFLLDSLYEIREKTTDVYAKGLVSNAVEKYNLNQMIQNRKLYS